MPPKTQYFKNKRIIVFGGTGSWGTELTKQLLKQKPKEIRIFSRGEHKQVEARRAFQAHHNIRFIIGDVRDRERVDLATNGVDIAFNLAALKHVPVCEENVWEAVQTNIHGAENIIQAAIHHKLEAAVQVSTDKAVDPINLYGYTKGTAERIFTSANDLAYNNGTKFVCIRGGNVLNTTGSVIPLFKHQIQKHNHITITHNDMSRFLMRVQDAIKLVLKAVSETVGGETFVMKMPGADIVDLAKVIIDELGNKDTKISTIGIRPGEKLYEVLVSKNESPRTVSDGDYFIILPYAKADEFKKKHYKSNRYITHEEYNSMNTNQLTAKQIKKLLHKDNLLDVPQDRFDSLFSTIEEKE